MTNYILITLSLLVICSYLFDLLAKRTKVPAVIMLLLSGIGLQYAAGYLNLNLSFLPAILPVLGTVGLILIVLEGALELDFSREKIAETRKAFFAALVILVATTAGITFLFKNYTQAPFMQCFLNAVPYSVISSAIAIPSVANLVSSKKEFIIYESSFSDILGITLFNFALTNDKITGYSVLTLGSDILITILLSAASCLLLLYLMKNIYHHIKFFLILAIIILIYATGKEFHFPTLFIVLAFGLLVNNAWSVKWPWFKKYFIYHDLPADLHQMKQLSAESAFIARTFFFVIFGLSMNVGNLADPVVLYIGIPVVGIIYLVRYLYLRLALKKFMPEFFVAPRGLISILLLFSIPVEQRLTSIGDGVMFLVILFTGLMIVAGLMGMRKTAEGI